MNSLVKKDILLFLGAGASTSFGKPTTRDLLENFKKEIPMFEGSDFLRKLVDSKYNDFEELLQAVYDIKRNLNSPYAGKFFNNWKDRLFLIDSLTTPGNYPVSSEAFWLEQVRRSNIHGFKSMIDNIDKSTTILEDVVIEKYRWNDDSNPILDKLYQPIFSFLKNNSSSLKIVTTNYDRAIENYCENNSMTFFDGFKDVSGTYTWRGEFYYPTQLDSDSVFLYKLHGSLNWKKRKDGKIVRGLGEARPQDRRYLENILIYPSLDIKNYDIAPYQAIRHEFEKSFNECELCIIIGCSFRDKEINSVLRGQDKKIVVISPTVENDINSNFLDGIQKLPNFKNIKPIPQPFDETTVNNLIKTLNSYL